jgi:hypothetical protein
MESLKMSLPSLLISRSSDGFLAQQAATIAFSIPAHLSHAMRQSDIGTTLPYLVFETTTGTRITLKRQSISSIPLRSVFSLENRPGWLVSRH